ncbi:ubiquitin carboxyl-terminal family 1 [Fusarium sp. NRRL 25303]|nr:ubiquitin carboxyl-terminal family 1 [Fusarium sp. NRRL 25303]
MAVYHSAEGRKFFVPLENNPQVFTNLAHDLGMDPKLAFHDVYSLDEPELLAMVPRPVHALIFITPSNAYFAVEAEDVAAGKRTAAPANRKTYSMEGFDDLYPTNGTPQPVLWFPQTIGNACGMVSLVHALLNGSLRERLVPSSPLAGLLDEALKLPLPTQHADLLYNSVVIEEAHSKAAARGDTAAPDAQDPIGYHFMAFVEGTDGNLWGLDGSFGGMMCYGPVGEGEDMLSSKVLDIGVRRFINAGEGSAEFSIIALSEGED